MSGLHLVRDHCPTKCYLAVPYDPIHPSLLSQPSQPGDMDVEALMESAQQTVEAVDARIRTSSSSCKMLRFERGSSSAREGSGNRLTCHKPGNEPIFSESESSVPPSAILELPTESANAVDPPAPTSAPLPAGSNLSTHHQTSHTPPIGTHYYTPPSGEVQTFFSLRKHVGARQYPFSPFAVQQKQDRELSHKLKEFTYPSSPPMVFTNPLFPSWRVPSPRWQWSVDL
ncbi:hypothetical protein EPI10_022042 [Gossypium australe]|uniref:Uncharacterized protein n=1 Tax=Gossypium australe TaxID=47621 RepID=A0A5B6WIT3_9ROSI|nr:hypothetical protein EPI10_022042 [Gossypium australe]